MIYKCLLDENNVVFGVFKETEDVEGNYILIDEELLNELTSLFYQKKYVGEITEKVLNIENISLFEKYISNEIKEKSELEILREKIVIQDSAIMELAEIISTMNGGI